MHFTGPQLRVMSLFRRSPRHVVFDRDLMPNQRQVMTNLVKKGAVIKMHEKPSIRATPAVCYTLGNERQPEMKKKTTNDQLDAAVLIRTALDDVMRGDRVDALDALRMASDIIRNSMPQHRPVTLNLNDFNRIEMLNRFTNTLKDSIQLARLYDLEMIGRPPLIDLVIVPATAHSGTSSRMKLDAHFDIHFQKKSA